jgi:hypothetical protein
VAVRRLPFVHAKSVTATELTWGAAGPPCVGPVVGAAPPPVAEGAGVPLPGERLPVGVAAVTVAVGRCDKDAVGEAVGLPAVLDGAVVVGTAGLVTPAVVGAGAAPVDAPGPATALLLSLPEATAVIATTTATTATAAAAAIFARRPNRGRAASPPGPEAAAAAVAEAACP